MKKLMIIVLLISFVLIPGILAAEDTEVIPIDRNMTIPATSYEGPSGGMIVLDLLVVRPLAAAGATISTAFCLITMPGAALFGVGEPWARVAVEAPWRFVGGRPLGDFRTYKDGKPITIVRRPL